MRVALVHDYFKELGGAERVLRVLSDMYPDAPIYTSFVAPNSAAATAFSDRQIIPWKHQWLINRYNLHSPLRFLIPLIWESFNLKKYDLVISSAASYVTKGVITHPHTLHLCYCHTPPRFLWGLTTARRFSAWPARAYGAVISHFLRQYDYLAAQRVDYFIANSKNVRARIKKFYGRESTIIYPPVEISPYSPGKRDSSPYRGEARRDRLDSRTNSSTTLPHDQITKLPENYFLIISRLVGTKGLDLLLCAARALPDQNFVVAGESPFSKRFLFERNGVESRTGYRSPLLDKLEAEKTNSSERSPNITWLGRVPDHRLHQLYTNCTAFLALAKDEDFGMTVVEAQAAGSPVIAYAGGGYLETVIEGKTGTFFPDYTPESLIQAIKSFKSSKYKPSACKTQARKFSRQKFEQGIRKLVKKLASKP